MISNNNVYLKKKIIEKALSSNHNRNHYLLLGCQETKEEKNLNENTKKHTSFTAQLQTKAKMETAIQLIEIKNKTLIKKIGK